MKTAVAAPEQPARPLYVLLLEEAVRELAHLVAAEGTPVHAAGLDPEVADIVERLVRR